jgi:hypothetical protein
MFAQDFSNCSSPRAPAGAQIVSAHLASRRLRSRRPLHCTRPTKLNRYSSSNLHFRAQNRVSNSHAFNKLQHPVQLIENKHDQVPLFSHSCALFSRKSRICHSYAKHTGGGVPPPDIVNLRAQKKLLPKANRALRARHLGSRGNRSPLLINPPLLPLGEKMGEKFLADGETVAAPLFRRWELQLPRYAAQKMGALAPNRRCPFRRNAGELRISRSLGSLST